MNLRRFALCRRKASRMRFLLTALLSIILIAESGNAQQGDATTPATSPDTTQSPQVQQNHSLTSVSLQFGGSFTSGLWFEERDGGIHVQLTGRVNMFKRCYVGLVYVNQSMSLTFSRWADYLGNFRANSPFDYIQHEVYAVVGLSSPMPRTRGRYVFAEFGAGVVVYTQEDLNEYEYWWSSHSDLGIRGAVGLVQTLSSRVGLILDINGRYTGSWHSYGSDTGTIVGVGIGLIILAGEE